jgi:L-alanine-DL-glutamate epimerase-like enolase superfamily enzyme
VKVTHVSTHIVSTPADNPLVVGLPDRGDTREFVTLVAAIPNGLTVEYMPWTHRLFQEIPPIVDGQLQVPSKPGLGLEFDRAAVRQYQVA